MLLDVNVLLALTLDTHVHHGVAHEHFSGLDQWHTCPVTEAGLMRLLLNEKVVGRKVTGAEVVEQLRAMRRTPGWAFLADDASLAAPVVDTRVLMGYRQVTDLHLVNLAASHATRLASFDAALVASLAPADRVHVDLWRG